MALAGNRWNMKKHSFMGQRRPNNNLPILSGSSQRREQPRLVLRAFRILVAIWPQVEGCVLLFQKPFFKPFPEKCVAI